MAQTRIAEILDRSESDLLADWTEDLGQALKHRGAAAVGLRRQAAKTFLEAFREALRAIHANDTQGLADDVWRATILLDKLGLFTSEIHQRDREDIIKRQQREMLELSTPVVRLWERVLALPLIGTLDSSRTQTVMENLLEAIVSNGAAIAIIDITGVPTVDTVVAQHLLKTVAAARLMGADCIISGIRPQIAATIIHLGVDLNEVTTKATLADAFQIALRRIGMSVTAAAKP
jgi:rsbT co-antagonist protein RsbR